MIERGAAWALADGADNGVDRQRRERGHKASLGLRIQPAGSGVRRAHLARGKKALAKIGEFGEAQSAKIEYFPGLGRICSPPLRRVCYFRIWVLRFSAIGRPRLRGLRERGASRRATQRVKGRR